MQTRARPQTFRVLSGPVLVLPCSARPAAAFRGASWPRPSTDTLGWWRTRLWASSERRGVGRIMNVPVSLTQGNRPLLGHLSRGLRGLVGTCGTITRRDLTTMGWKRKTWRNMGLSCPLQIGLDHHFELSISHASRPSKLVEPW